MKFLTAILLSFVSITASAVTISPNKVLVEGQKNSMAALQFKIYGHPTDTDIEFVKVEDLKADHDKLLSTFTLSKEQQYIMPLDILLKENKEYYLCAVLKNSKSMRLRTCAKVTVKVQ